MSIEKITSEDGLSQSKNIIQENIEQLKKLFPEIVTEGKIDFKSLQQVLGEEIEDEEEFYRFTWAGKSQSRREAHKPSTGTLRPCKEESLDWDTTQNLYIEGDNLEVLKLLQKSYSGKIKMIYIDPPYNTGKDFIYKDNYKDNLKNYQEITGQVDSDGKTLSTNSDSDGRYHSNWLNMMYPRLKLARNLLKDDGVIFMSIDDNEIDNLKKIGSEIFGESNFIGQITWKSTQKNDPRFIAINHEYVLVFSKNIDSLKDKWRITHPLVDEVIGVYNNLKSKYKEDLDTIQLELRKELKKPKYEGIRHYKCVDQKGVYFPADISDPQRKGPKHDFVIHPKTKMLCKPPSGGYSPREDEMRRRIENDEIHYGDNHETVVCYKKYIETAEDRLNSVYYEDGRRASKYLQDLFDGKKIFDYPKSELFLKRIIEFVATNNDIVLDFFSGSSSSADAVFQHNIEKGSHISFIQIQLPEIIDIKSESYQLGYKTITDIGKERIRRVVRKIHHDYPESSKEFDLGFKVFKLDSSNIKEWDGSVKDERGNLKDVSNQIRAFEENIKSDRTEEDVLYEILLKYGLDLTLPIEERNIQGKKVFNVGMGSLFICLSDDITSKVAEGIGEWKKECDPEVCRVIFKDNGFTDIEKTNSVQILKRFGINEIRSI